MRIGTWNVEYAPGTDKNERRLRRLREMNADLWILTETHDRLVPGNDYRAASTTPRPAKGPEGARWTTIWSRYPITRSVKVADPDRTVAAIIETPLGPLLVYGTVLPRHTDGGPSGKEPHWSEHHRVVPLQAKEWVALREAHPGIAMCVAGDFNMNLGGPHVYGTTMGREKLREGLEAAGLVCLTETERVPEEQLRHGAIDHIAVSAALAEGATLVGAWEGTDSDGVRLSDHSGLVVEIGRATPVTDPT